MLEKQGPACHHSTERKRESCLACLPFLPWRWDAPSPEIVPILLVALKRWEKGLKQVFLSMADVMPAARGKKPEVVLP